MDMRKLAKGKKKFSKEEAAAYEASLAAGDPGLETPMISPDEILAGGLPSAARGISSALASGALKEALLANAANLGSELGGVNLGKVILKDALTNKTIPRSEFISAGKEAARRVVLKVDGKIVPKDTIIEGATEMDAGRLLSDVIKKRK